MVSNVYGYSDSYWNGDQDDRNITTCYLFMLRLIQKSWSSKMQGIVVLSSCETECVAVSYDACQTF